MISISSNQLEQYNQAAKTPQTDLAMHALSKSDLDSVAFVHQSANKLRHKFSVEIETLEVTNQKSSGRCWLFAATNILRERIAAMHKIEKFELSQSYLAFWDKFERCNYFFESIIETAYLPTDDRTVMHILSTGVHDGGQWEMFANIVRKYGIVPKDVYDETYQSSNTRRMNYVLNRYLKRSAAQIRKHIQGGAAETRIQELKQDMLCRIYRFLVSCYGFPPERFDFEFVDKDHKYHVEKNLTPLSFADKYHIPQLLDQTVSIIHAPTEDKPYGKLYTIRYLGNVIDGHAVQHLNLSMSDMKKAIISQLKDGKAVWFGSDVGHYGDRDLGIWDDHSFDYEQLTGLDMNLTKEDSLNYGLSSMNHAMVLTGVHIENEKPVRWRIENSWGDEHGNKGYYVCSDSWFEQYVYQVAIEREYLGENVSLLKQSPIILPPWDPMGTLAD